MLIPLLGNRAVDEIEAPEIIPVIMAVANRGAVDSAKRIKGMIQQVFDYALVRGKVSCNPARDINLTMLLLKTIKTHYSAITDPKDLAKLLRDIDAYHGSIAVKSALQIAPMIMARPSEISEGEWSEIDLKKRLGKNRVMTSITLRIPVDVVDDMKSYCTIDGIFWLSGIVKSLCRAWAKKRFRKA